MFKMDIFTKKGGIMKKEITRKEFIQYCTFGLLSLGSLPLLTSCSGKEEESTPQMNEKSSPETSADPCGDLTGLTNAEIEVRKNFEYVAQTPDPAKRCDNCGLWVVPAEGQKCGGCKIIKGPINPDGHCTAWVPMEG